jgi:hypothetical protein
MDFKCHTIVVSEYELEFIDIFVLAEIGKAVAYFQLHRFLTVACGRTDDYDGSQHHELHDA